MAVKLKATRREDLTTSTTKRIRKSGQVPGVVYGQQKKANAIAVNSIELVKTVRDEGRNAIISLDVENDKPVDVMLHEYQMDPIRDELVHVDFYIVNMAEEMNVEVPIRTFGEAKGIKEGGVLQQPLYEIQVRAKPADIPDEISVDVSQLEIGDTITIADLPTGEKYEFLDEEDATVVTVVPPDTAEEVTEETEENAEPAIVGAKSEEDE